MPFEKFKHAPIRCFAVRAVIKNKPHLADGVRLSYLKNRPYEALRYAKALGIPEKCTNIPLYERVPITSRYAANIAVNGMANDDLSQIVDQEVSFCPVVTGKFALACLTLGHMKAL